jgi:hypothetical protein
LDQTQKIPKEFVTKIFAQKSEIDNDAPFAVEVMQSLFSAWVMRRTHFCHAPATKKGF